MGGGLENELLKNFLRELGALLMDTYYKRVAAFWIFDGGNFFCGAAALEIFFNGGLFCAVGAEILNKFSASPSSKKLSFW